MSDSIIIASAGAGKTRRIVRSAIAHANRGKKVLITTYTNRNVAQIAERIARRCGGTLPPEIRVTTWFVFLLREAIKPYQSAVTEPFSVHSINFEIQRSRYIRRSETKRYFFDAGMNVYVDFVADLACELNNRTSGEVVDRLERIYDVVLIDELQDLVAYDLVFMEDLLRSRIQFMAVGDPRQFTFAANRSSKYKQFRGLGILNWARGHEEAGRLTLEKMNWSHRCTQAICDFGDSLFPELPATVSRNRTSTNHDGVFAVANRDLTSYINRFRPMILRWNRNMKLPLGVNAACANIGEVKGETYDRVLVLSTEPMRNYLQTGQLKGDSHRFYVAATRARQSVAFSVKSRSFESEIAETWVPENDGS